MKPPTTIQQSETRPSPLIYLVGEDQVHAELLNKSLTINGYQVKIFLDINTFFDTCSSLDKKHPDAIVMDMVIPDSNDMITPVINNLTLCKKNNIPVIITAERDDFRVRLSALRAGACRYLSKPVNTKRITSIQDELTDFQPQSPYRILIIDDEITSLKIYSSIMIKAGLVVHTLSEPLETLETITDFNPDVVVLDMHMPVVSGLEIAAILRERDVQLPILFLSGETDVTKQLLALNLGGDDFLTKPVEPEYLTLTVIARARRARDKIALQHRLEKINYEFEREHHALNQHAIVSIADKNGIITYVNDKFCEISGYSREELLGQNHSIVKSNHHAEKFYQNLWKTILNGDIWQGEICNQSKDGRLYWVESTITPFLDEKGTPYQYTSIRTDISHRKEAELTLKINQERLRRGQIFANIGTWDWHIDTGELYWSERIGPLFGYKEGELETSYDNFMKAVHPDDRDMVSSAVTACAEHDTPYNIEHRVVWPDGTVRWLQERGAVIRDDAGIPLQMLGVVQDIDDRKRAELALSESERELREAQALSHIGSWQANLISGELTWSEEIYHIFGHKPGSFKPSVEAFHAAIHPDDVEKVNKSEKQAEETGRHDVIHRIIRPNGTVRHVHELARAEKDASGKLISLRGTVQDITQQIETENQLIDIEDRHTFAIEGAGDGIWDWDMRSNDVQYSKLWMGMLDYEENELPYTLDTFFSLIHPDDKPNVQQSVENYLQGKIQVYAIKIRMCCKDGTYKWIMSRGKLVSRDNQGNPQRMTGIHTDINELIQIQQELSAARDEAERANHAKSDFLSSMSHELRTPMNAIIGFGQLLEYDDTLSSDHQDNVHEIIKAGQHLLSLINEVLDLAKVESGQIDLSLEPIEICSVVEECLVMVASMAEKRNISLSHSGIKNKVIRADRTRLIQVILNLLSNAIKYNCEGGIVKLDVVRASKGLLRIKITDTGLGIPAEQLAELFQPFNRLGAKESTIEGTGIGLTITRRIVELMGGTVDVESEVGVGSAFFIDLPEETLSVSKRERSGVTIDTASQIKPNMKSQHTVLYIEDNPSNLKLVTQIFGQRDHISLLTAHTPELGIELATARKPDLILLDINMPGMDGYQVLEVFKANHDLKNTPVIAVTAMAMPRDIEHGKKAGFTDYVTKPIDIDYFLKLVDHCLQIERGK